MQCASAFSTRAADSPVASQSCCCPCNSLCQCHLHSCPFAVSLLWTLAGTRTSVMAGVYLQLVVAWVFKTLFRFRRAFQVCHLTRWKTQHSGACLFCMLVLQRLSVMFAQEIALSLFWISRIIHKINPNPYALNMISICAFIDVTNRFLPTAMLLTFCSITNLFPWRM